MTHVGVSVPCAVRVASVPFSREVSAFFWSVLLYVSVVGSCCCRVCLDLAALGLSR